MSKHESTLLPPPAKRVSSAPASANEEVEWNYSEELENAIANNVFIPPQVILAEGEAQRFIQDRQARLRGRLDNLADDLYAIFCGFDMQSVFSEMGSTYGFVANKCKRHSHDGPEPAYRFLALADTQGCTNFLQLCVCLGNRDQSKCAIPRHSAATKLVRITREEELKYVNLLFLMTWLDDVTLKAMDLKKMLPSRK